MEPYCTDGKHRDVDLEGTVAVKFFDRVNIYREVIISLGRITDHKSDSEENDRRGSNHPSRDARSVYDPSEEYVGDELCGSERRK